MSEPIVTELTPFVDDRATALQAAATALAPRLAVLSSCFEGVSEQIPKLAGFVTQMADEFLPWLRQLGSGRLTLVAIEEIDDGSIVWTPTGGVPLSMTTIDSSQRARYTFKAKDDRGFAADYALAARSTDESIVTVEYFNVGDPGNTSNGTTDPDTGASTEFDQVLATFAGSFGAATVEVYDPAGDTSVVIAHDDITTEPGAVGTGDLGTASIEEIPTT